LKLHIHFGIHRTGTTSIHSALVNNLSCLSEYGYLYPDLGVERRHVRTAWQLISKKIDGDRLVKLIKEEIQPSTKKIILSSEDFSQLRDFRWLEVLSNHFDLSASVYLRRQDLWLESWYNQHIKWPWDKRFSSSTPEFFLSKKGEFYWLDYHWLLSAIGKYIDRDDIYVQVMERSSVADTTVDFLKCIGVDPNIIDIKKPKNASLTKCQLDILRKIDLIGTKPKQRNRINKTLMGLDISECDGSKSVFDSSQRENILSFYSEINERVAQEFFSREKLFMDKVYYPAVNSLEESLIYNKYLPMLIKGLSL